MDTPIITEKLNLIDNTINEIKSILNINQQTFTKEKQLQESSWITYLINDFENDNLSLWSQRAKNLLSTIDLIVTNKNDLDLIEFNLKIENIINAEKTANEDIKKSLLAYLNSLPGYIEKTKKVLPNGEEAHHYLESIILDKIKPLKQIENNNVIILDKKWINYTNSFIDKKRWTFINNIKYLNYGKTYNNDDNFISLYDFIVNKKQSKKVLNTNNSDLFKKSWLSDSVFIDKVDELLSNKKSLTMKDFLFIYSSTINHNKKKQYSYIKNMLLSNYSEVINISNQIKKSTG